MQRDGEGRQEQQSMEQKHDYVRTINLFMGSRQETTPLCVARLLESGIREAAHIPLLISFIQVRQWLEKVFSGEEVPEYEINSHTVDCLYRMAQDSETREREAEVMMEDFEQKAEEYAAESEYTRKIFHGKECECYF